MSTHRQTPSMPLIISPAYPRPPPPQGGRKGLHFGIISSGFAAAVAAAWPQGHQLLVHCHWHPMTPLPRLLLPNPPNCQAVFSSHCLHRWTCQESRARCIRAQSCITGVGPNLHEHRALVFCVVSVACLRCSAAVFVCLRPIFALLSDACPHFHSL